MIAFDLAIIGSTGVDTKRFDTWVLGCDSTDESTLKARLLAMSNFRIVLLDSDKLLQAAPGSMFASISKGDIDLIITDSGISKMAKEAVSKLLKQCVANDVGLIIAELDETQKDESKNEGAVQTVNQEPELFS